MSLEASSSGDEQACVSLNRSRRGRFRCSDLVYQAECQETESLERMAGDGRPCGPSGGAVLQRCLEPSTVRPSQNCRLPRNVTGEIGWATSFGTAAGL